MTALVFKPSNQLTFANAELDRIRLFNLYSKDKADITCDLSHVTQCDSAGLALLIEAKRLAHKYGKDCQFSGMTRDIKVLAEFCGVNQILWAELA